MIKRLTKRSVDTAEAGKTLWDDRIPGFGLRVSKGGAKSYALKYRRGGAQRWLTIGRHGAPWTPDTARKEARRLLGFIAEGRDPAAERAEARNAEEFAAFADRYLNDHARVHKKSASVGDDERNLRNHILPKFRRLLVRDIMRQDIARLHLSMKETPYAANRCLALLSHMFKKAEAWGLRPDGSNPCAHVDKFKEKARERFLSAEEIAQLGRVLAKTNGRAESPAVVAAVRLLLLTGARLNEILTLKWSQVDFDARLLRLSDSKTGEKTIVLSEPAIEVLTSLPRMAENPFVIYGRKKGTHLVNLQKPWRRIRAEAGLEDVRIHDLRHSFASIAAANGMSLPMIGSLLGHSQAQTTQRYAHLADDPRHEAVHHIATAIASNLSR